MNPRGSFRIEIQKKKEEEEEEEKNSKFTDLSKLSQLGETT